MSQPTWTLLLRDEDEWVVRTALANVASDLEKVAEEAVATMDATKPTVSAGPAVRALRESAARYRDVLARIEMGEVAEELIG